MQTISSLVKVAEIPPFVSISLMYSDGYIVFAFHFVRSYFFSARYLNLRQSFVSQLYAYGREGSCPRMVLEVRTYDLLK